MYHSLWRAQKSGAVWIINLNRFGIVLVWAPASQAPQNNLQNVCQQQIPPNDPAMWITLIHLVAKDIVVSSSHAARILRPVGGHGHGKLPLRIPQDVGTAAGSLSQCLRERRFGNLLWISWIAVTGFLFILGCYPPLGVLYFPYCNCAKIGGRCAPCTTCPPEWIHAFRCSPLAFPQSETEVQCWDVEPCWEFLTNARKICTRWEFRETKFQKAQDIVDSLHLTLPNGHCAFTTHPC